MAIYDPSLELTDALHESYTRLALINTNTENSINLGLRCRQAVGFASGYDYGKPSQPFIERLRYADNIWVTDLVISSNPNIVRVCDTVSNHSYPRHVTSFMRTPTFERTTALQQMAMSWLVNIPTLLLAQSVANPLCDYLGCRSICGGRLFFCAISKLDLYQTRLVRLNG